MNLFACDVRSASQHCLVLIIQLIKQISSSRSGCLFAFTFDDLSALIPLDILQMFNVNSSAYCGIAPKGSPFIIRIIPFTSQFTMKILLIPNRPKMMISVNDPSAVNKFPI